MIEIWKPLVGAEGRYEVSSFGRMRSFLGRGKRGGLTQTPQLLSLNINGQGYFHKYLKLNSGDCKNVRIHRAVAEAFIANPFNLPVVNHKDGDKTNNHVDNLEWCTSQLNNQHAFATGLIKHARGERSKKSNLTNRDVLDIFNSKDTCYSLAAKYGVNHTCISDIRNGRTWNHVTGLECKRKKPKFCPLPHLVKEEKAA